MVCVFSNAVGFGLRRRIILASRRLARTALDVRRRMELGKLENVSRSASGCAAIDALHFRRIYLAQKKQPKFSAYQLKNGKWKTEN